MAQTSAAPAVAANVHVALARPGPATSRHRIVQPAPVGTPLAWVVQVVPLRTKRSTSLLANVHLKVAVTVPAVVAVTTAPGSGPVLPDGPWYVPWPSEVVTGAGTGVGAGVLGAEGELPPQPALIKSPIRARAQTDLL